QDFEQKSLRLDELIFDYISELTTIHPDFIFEVNYIPAGPDPELLIIKGNEMLIQQAFQNLLNNSISYSNNGKAEIIIDASQNNNLVISIANTGKPVSKDEQKYLFTHFFRGENSRDKIGFGL